MRSIIFRKTFLMCHSRAEYIMEGARAWKYHDCHQPLETNISWNHLKLNFFPFFYVECLVLYSQKKLHRALVAFQLIVEQFERLYETIPIEGFRFNSFDNDLHCALWVCSLHCCKQLVGSMVIKAVIVMMKNVYGLKNISHCRVEKMSNPTMVRMSNSLKWRHWAKHFDWCLIVCEGKQLPQNTS